MYNHIHVPFRILGAALCLMTFLFIPISGLHAAEAGGRETAFFHAYFAGEIRDHKAAIAESLLALAPPEKLDEIRSLYAGALGELKEAVGRDGGYDLIFAKGKAPARIRIGPDGKVDMLWFGQWSLFTDDPSTLAAEFAKLSGKVSVTVRRDDRENLVSIDSDTPLAVGSAFKLYVLKALVRAVAAGNMRPDTVVSLRPEWQSLPTGVTQDWPAGTPVTLATLANLMISISDNTATDHLIHTLGREAVEAIAPERMRPFLTTFDLFRLKYSNDTARAERFAKADVATRRAMLAELGTAPVSIADIRTTPFHVDTIEWHATTDELCRVLFELREHPAVGINPGLVRKNQWRRVAFKGGSEPGVLNYTISLQKAQASPTYVLSATINDTAHEVNTASFTELVTRLISLIEDGRLK
ncbi:MAG TPA: serine hydrolase [Candidatus Ozemobacteraceae bacterium]|nr:serine hydrolase [Candidatus Ozemobacteraceae bacterium]HQG29051.1 serine hydrolase [Candidatus Ozemobacteraceae bacterium]